MSQLGWGWDRVEDEGDSGKNYSARFTYPGNRAQATRHHTDDGYEWLDWEPVLEFEKGRVARDRVMAKAEEFRTLDDDDPTTISGAGPLDRALQYFAALFGIK